MWYKVIFSLLGGVFVKLLLQDSWCTIIFQQAAVVVQLVVSLATVMAVLAVAGGQRNTSIH